MATPIIDYTAAIDRLSNDQVGDEVGDDSPGMIFPNLPPELLPTPVNPYHSLIILDEHRISRDFYQKNMIGLSTNISLEQPKNLRSTIMIQIAAPRRYATGKNPVYADNPSNQRYHVVTVVITGLYMDETTFKYSELPAGTGEEGVEPLFRLASSLETKELAYLDFEISRCVVYNSRLPPLKDSAYDKLMESVVERFQRVAAEPIRLHALVRRVGSNLSQSIASFREDIVGQKKHDPLQDFFKDTPNKQSLTMGNIHSPATRPIVALQACKTVFADLTEWRVFQAYSAVYEQDYREALRCEIASEEVQAKFVEMPSSRLAVGGPANAYWVIIKVPSSMEKPQPGDALRITIKADKPEDAPYEAPDMGIDNPLPQPGYEPSPSAPTLQTWPEKNLPYHVDNGVNTDLLTPNPDHETEAIQEDLEEANSENAHLLDGGEAIFGPTHNPQANPNEWTGYVVSIPLLTSKDSICVAVRRRRQPNWDGPPELQPFVKTHVAAIDLTTAGDNNGMIKEEAKLKSIIEAADSMTISMSLIDSAQTFRDEIRSFEKLTSTTEKAELCAYLTGAAKMGTGTHDTDLKSLLSGTFHEHFTKSQLEFYHSLERIEHGIAVLHGPYGTGKTDCLLDIVTEFQAPKLGQKTRTDLFRATLIASPSNEAANDAALRLEEKCAKRGIKMNIIRVYSLKGEKSAVVNEYAPAIQAPSRFDFSLTEGIFEDFAAMSQMRELEKEFDQNSDHRRDDAQHLSLSSKMLAYLEEFGHVHPDLMSLKDVLVQRGQDGIHTVDPAKREVILQSINRLVKLTLANADVVFCTLNTASRFNLEQNFRPHLVIVDEACRATELSTLIVLAHYNPVAFILAGDPMQLRPTVFTADTLHHTPYFLNPFSRQMLLSLQERLMKLGHPTFMLQQQHRCKGSLDQFANYRFYYGMVTSSEKAGQLLDPTTRDLREFAVELGVDPAHPGNVIGLYVNNSRSHMEEGTKSSVNPDHILATRRVIDQLLNRPTFIKHKTNQPGTILVLAMYKGQVALYHKSFKTLPADLRHRVQVRTVDSAQGYEDDVVFVDFVGQRPGFTGEGHRLNVATTRARNLMIIVINPQIIPTNPDSDLSTIPRANTLKKTAHIVALLKHLELHQRIVSVDADSSMCERCETTDHTSRECPILNACRNCHQPGHRARDCPNPRAAKPVSCRGCGVMGHKKADCPQRTCKRCLLPGHTANVCTNEENLTQTKCLKCGQNGHRQKTCNWKPTRRNLADMAHARLTGGTVQFEASGWDEPSATTKESSHTAAESQGQLDTWGEDSIILPPHPQDDAWGSSTSADVPELQVPANDAWGFSMSTVNPPTTWGTSSLTAEPLTPNNVSTWGTSLTVTNPPAAGNVTWEVSTSVAKLTEAKKFNDSCTESESETDLQDIDADTPLPSIDQIGPLKKADPITNASHLPTNPYGNTHIKPSASISKSSAKSGDTLRAAPPLPPTENPWSRAAPYVPPIAQALTHAQTANTGLWKVSPNNGWAAHGFSTGKETGDDASAGKDTGDTW